MAVLARYDMPLADQVIEVPKVSCPARCGRTVLCTPQTAEELVEVPTILTPSFLRMLQNVDIPVPHGGRGASGGLQGFLPGHVEQTVDFPASCSGVRRLQGFFPEQSSTATSSSLERISERNVEQIVDSCGFGGGLQDLRPGLSSSSSSRDPARVSEALDEPGEGVFRTFPQIKKKATLPPHSWSELRPHSSPWTPAAYDVPMVLEAEEEEESEEELDDDVEFMEYDGRWWGVRVGWWLAASGGSQAGHINWRPPWLIGRGPG